MPAKPTVEFRIRKASHADAQGILECLQAAFEPYRTQYSALAYADTVLSPGTIRGRLESMHLFVATSGDGSVVGTIGGSAKARDGHLRGMAVLPSWQGSGVAEGLLEAVEEELRRQGCSRTTLDTTRPLQRAIRFYRKHGYRSTGAVIDFLGMPLFEYAKMIAEEPVMKVVNLNEKFSTFSEHWSPKIVGELNDSYVKVAKLKGEFLWHHHDNEDELFLVIKGTLRMKFRDREEKIGPGEFIIVPRGTEHLPAADEEVHLVLLEPKTTLNTGNIQNERTREDLDRI